MYTQPTPNTIQTPHTHTKKTQVKLHANARKEGFSVNALREINILLALRHPNIVGVREMVVGGSLDKVYMVMDYFDNDLKVWEWVWMGLMGVSVGWLYCIYITPTHIQIHT